MDLSHYTQSNEWNSFKNGKKTNEFEDNAHTESQKKLEFERTKRNQIFDFDKIEDKPERYAARKKE